jgi:hypothetical protein
MRAGSLAAAAAALKQITGKGKLVAIYDHSGPSASGSPPSACGRNYVSDAVEDRPKPGDAKRHDVAFNAECVGSTPVEVCRTSARRTRYVTFRPTPCLLQLRCGTQPGG